MARFDTWLRSDLKQMVRVQKLPGLLFSADNASNLIGVIITDNGEPANISGGVTGYVVRADDKTVLVNGTMIGGDKAYIILPASAYIIPGPISIVIKVGTTTVCACNGTMYQSSTDAIIDPGHFVPSLEELLAHINDAIQAADTANSAAVNANAAANNANQKASAADTATANANTAAYKIDNMTVSGSELPAGSSLTVVINEVSGHKNISFGIPKGDKGDKGDPGSIVITYDADNETIIL